MTDIFVLVSTRLILHAEQEVSVTTVPLMWANLTVAGAIVTKIKNTIKSHNPL